MATYDNLPVYKTSYDFLLETFRAVKNIKREYKYTVGRRIEEEAMEMLVDIYKANSSYTKSSFIQSARERLEIIRLLLRLLKDLQQINLPKFVRLNELIESISKQLTGWQKSCDKR